MCPLILASKTKNSATHWLNSIKSKSKKTDNKEIKQNMANRNLNNFLYKVTLPSSSPILSTSLFCPLLPSSSCPRLLLPGKAAGDTLQVQSEGTFPPLIMKSNSPLLPSLTSLRNEPGAALLLLLKSGVVHEYST